jgi:hypothetical protein
MSTASTQFEDERRLEFLMQKRHREAALEAELRRARDTREPSRQTLSNPEAMHVTGLLAAIGRALPIRALRPRPAPGRP